MENNHILIYMMWIYCLKMKFSLWVEVWWCYCKHQNCLNGCLCALWTCNAYYFILIYKGIRKNKCQAIKINIYKWRHVIACIDGLYISVTIPVGQFMQRIGAELVCSKVLRCLSASYPLCGHSPTLWNNNFFLQKNKKIKIKIKQNIKRWFIVVAGGECSVIVSLKYTLRGWDICRNGRHLYMQGRLIYKCTVITNIHIYCACKHTHILCLQTYTCTVLANIHMYCSCKHTHVLFLQTYTCTVLTNIHIYCACKHTHVLCLQIYTCTVLANIHMYYSYKHTHILCLQTYTCTVLANIHMYCACKHTHVLFLQTYTCTVLALWHNEIHSGMRHSIVFVRFPRLRVLLLWTPLSPSSRHWSCRPVTLYT